MLAKYQQGIEIGRLWST